MRFKTLRTVIALVVIVVITVSVAVALVRRFVFPAPPGEHHGHPHIVRNVTAV